MDISLCALNTKSDSMQWAGANNPLWIISKGEFKEIRADKQPVGKYPESKPFTNHSVSLQKGDRIYIFTDGFADQFGGSEGKKFKIAAMRSLLMGIQHENLSVQHSLISKAFEVWKGSLRQVDDVCLIGVQY